MNANLIHNILNLVGLILGVLVTFDWTTFGMTQAGAAALVGFFLIAQNALKLFMNIGRDGVTGLTKTQPPVIK